MYYVVINTQNNECLVYKDKKEAAKSVGVAYITIERALKKSKVYIKGDFIVYLGEIVPSNRGNPRLND
jgi:hypothetical protein